MGLWFSAATLMKQKKVQPKQKHVPHRVCIACREAAGKRTLVRIVRTKAGVQVDSSGKMPGRGAYLHPDQACWQAALSSNRLAQSLRTKVSDEDLQEIEAVFAALGHALIG